MGKFESAEDKPQTGVGKYGTAPPLTAHKGRSKPAERSTSGATILDAVTKACQAVLTSFIGNPALIENETTIPKLVRKQGSGDIGEDTPDSVIINRFRNILSSRTLPKGAAQKWDQIKKERPVEMLNKQARRLLKRAAARDADPAGTASKKAAKGKAGTASKKRAAADDEDDGKGGGMKLHKKRADGGVKVSKNVDAEWSKPSRFDLHVGR
mmetsp:Transcript_3191/g.5431  ORF Transcript_3191/g.5431 Transcript_3191/m.5431 type:complete len:211 (+) Transcript_3191:325-957(+)